MGPNQLDEAGYIRIATPHCQAKVGFFFDQYGPLLALIYFHVTQSLLFNSYVLLTTRSVISMLQNVLHTFIKFLIIGKQIKMQLKCTISFTSHFIKLKFEFHKVL